MSLKSKLGIESTGMLVAFLFYVVVGIVFLVMLAMLGPMPHTAVIGILNILTGYGVFKRRKWTVWFAAIMFVVATTFSAYMLIYLIGDYFTAAGLLAYLVLAWVFTGYVMTRRDRFES
ncbi:MAG: hypothetical protein QW840_02890 [Candidatus Bathyarchaeia archaeon]